MRLLCAILSVATASLFAGVVPARAQGTAEYDTPAHVSVVDGHATLEREGRIEEAVASMPLAAGDRLRTDSGRLEILFADASALHVDEHTTLDIADSALLRLTEGRVFLVVASGSTARYRVDTPTASVDVDGPGEYRVAILNYAGRIESELAVVRGSARLVNDGGEALVHAGQRSLAEQDRAPAYPMAFNSAAWDAFDRWSEQRRGARAGMASTQYLPAEVRGYSGVFDQYGSWTADAAYGYVWYPQVAVDWRPYYNGSWYHGRRWGLTWISGDPWGWPTHHFGRWGLSGGGRWFWIPARRWNPAWVAWSSAPGFYGWCPLGFDGRAVFSVGFVGSSRGHHGGWDRAWTFVPARNFGQRTHIPRVALGRGGFGPGFGGFREHSSPPLEAFVRNRGDVSTAASTRRAVPRSPGSRSAPFATPAPSLDARVTSRGVGGRATVNGGRNGLPARQIQAVPRNTNPVDSPYERARRVMETPRRPDGSAGQSPRSLPPQGDSRRSLGAPGIRTPYPGGGLSPYGQTWQRQATPRSALPYSQRLAAPQNARPSAPAPGVGTPYGAPYAPRMATPRTAPPPAASAAPSRGAASPRGSAAPRGGEQRGSARDSGGRRR